MRGKVLRGMGIALIAMPEPFTTPLGVGLLAASWVLSRHQQSQKKAYVRHLVTEYLHTYRPFGYGMGSQPKTSAALPYREPEPLYHASEVSTTRAWESTIPLPRTDQGKIIQHSFDLSSVARRFDKGGAKRGFEGYWGRGTKLDLAAVRHSLDAAVCLS